MAKLDRRMMLSLDDDTYSLLMEFAEASEKPAATLVREILQASAHQIKQSIRMLEQIKKGLLAEGLEMVYQTSAEAQMRLFEEQQKFAEAVNEVRKSGATQKEIAEAAKVASKGKRGRRK